MVGRKIFASRGVSSPCEGCWMIVVVQKNRQSNGDRYIGVMVVADDVDCGMVVLLRLLAMVEVAVAFVVFDG